MIYTRRHFLQRTSALAAVASGAAFHSGAAMAQSDRPLRWFVPFTAGGGADIVARLLTQRMQPLMQQSLVVENRPGGATIIATQALLNQPADGATVMSANEALAVNPSLYKDLPYNAEQDLEFVSLLARIPMVLVVRHDSPIANAAALLRHMKDSSQKITYATWGVGSMSHLTMEALNDRQGIRTTHVPYQGTAPALKDLVGGVVDVMFADIPGALPLIQGGRIRALAVSTIARSSALPELPTLDELGFKGFNHFSYQGLVARKGIPIDRLCVFRRIVTADFGIVTAHFGHRDRPSISAHRDRPFRYRDRPFRRS